MIVWGNERCSIAVVTHALNCEMTIDNLTDALRVQTVALIDSILTVH